jgi:hypothetical protein
LARDGLDLAYADPTGVTVVGDTMYIAGTRTSGEWMLDVVLPFGGVKYQPRYRSAVSLLSPEVTQVVGHSMGGTVAQQLVREHSSLTGTSYGAPPTLFKLPGKRMSRRFTRKRDLLDPVSMFDLGAVTHNVWKPHSYGY